MLGAHRSRRPVGLGRQPDASITPSRGARVARRAAGGRAAFRRASADLSGADPPHPARHLLHTHRPPSSIDRDARAVELHPPIPSARVVPPPQGVTRACPCLCPHSAAHAPYQLRHTNALPASTAFSSHSTRSHHTADDAPSPSRHAHPSQPNIRPALPSLRLAAVLAYTHLLASPVTPRALLSGRFSPGCNGATLRAYAARPALPPYCLSRRPALRVAVGPSASLPPPPLACRESSPPRLPHRRSCASERRTSRALRRTGAPRARRAR